VPKIRFDQVLALVLFCALLILHPTWKTAEAAGPQKSGALSDSQNQNVGAPTLTIKAPLLIPVYQGSLPPQNTIASLSASAIYIMDRDSGAILYQKNSDAPRYPASTAKMMTAIVSRKVYSLDRVLTVKEAAFTTGTVAGLKLGEEITVENLLKALLIPSGNDAALVLGENHPFGYQGFVTQMNQLATALHLSKTTFHNVSGLDSDNELSSARDLAILANELMKDPVLRSIVGTSQTKVTDQSGQQVHYLKSTQELYGEVPGVVGIKTGTTENAGENLITEIDRGDHKVIIVVLGSTDRFGETKYLINWVFSHYEWQTVAKN